MTDTIFFLILMIAIFSIPAMLYNSTLKILNEKGYKYSGWLITIGQFRKFAKIMKEEKNLKLKNKYRLIFWSQMALFSNPFIVAIISFASV